MSLFKDPAEHAANPPESWEVVKVSDRRWALQLSNGSHLSTNFLTKKAAEAAKSSGFDFDLYQKESAWYAGEPVSGWKPYAECVAEQERIAARWAVPAHA